MSNPFSNVEKVNAIIRVRRGPEMDRTLNIYDSGELIFSTDKKRLFIGDSIDNGATGAVGGIVVGNKNWVTNNFENLSGIVTYDTVYRTDTSNYYLFIGIDYLRLDNYILINTSGTSDGGVSYTLPPATSSNLGGVIIKDGLVVSNGYLRVDVDNDTIKIDPTTKKLTAVAKADDNNTVYVASENILGIVKVPLDSGIKVSSGDISVNVDNSTIKLTATPTGSQLYVDGSLVKIPVTTNYSLGVVRTGSGLSASSTGTLNLNIASYSEIGGVRVGTGLNINSNDGTLSVDGTLYDSIPLGSVHWFAMSAAPIGFLQCSGGILSIDNYYDLFGVIGTTYNDGLSTQYYNSSDVLTGFKIPDLRGEFIRGWDDGRGVDTGRMFGTFQEDMFESHTHTSNTTTGTETVEGTLRNAAAALSSTTTGATGGSETRPRNVALLPCIKVFKTVNDIELPTGGYIPKPELPNDKDILIFEDDYGTGGSWIAAPSSTYAGEALLSANGYQKLPSGLIMQWGITSVVSGENFVNVNLPIPFTTQGFNINATISGNTPSVSGTNTVKASFVNLSSISLINDEYTLSGSFDNSIFWQALGY